MMASINFVFKHFQPYAHPSLQHFALVKNGNMAILRSLVSLEMFLAYQKEGKRMGETRVFALPALRLRSVRAGGGKKKHGKRPMLLAIVQLHERSTIRADA
jgi:hypothetical protein